MSTVVYSDVIVPQRVVMAGITGKLTRKNDRTMNQGGYATANVVRDVSLREYTIGIKPMLLSAWREVLGLYEITDAGAFGMLLEDPADAFALDTEGKVTLVSSKFYLFKRYKAAGSTRYRDRKITRPKSPITLYRNGVAIFSGYTVNYDTGEVTITSPSSDTFTWSGGFYVPVQFAADDIEWDLMRPGLPENRLVAGPQIVLTEIREP